MKRGILTLIFGMIIMVSMGQITFQKSYGGTYNNDYVAYSVRQTNDGGYIMTGMANDSFGNSVCLIKTNSAGDTLFTKIFKADEDNAGNCVQQTFDGGYIIVGSSGAAI